MGRVAQRRHSSVAGATDIVVKLLAVLLLEGWCEVAPVRGPGDAYDAVAQFSQLGCNAGALAWW